LNGCLIPATELGTVDPHPFDSRNLEQFRVGATTKTDVIAILDAPSNIFESGTVWVYESVRSRAMRDPGVGDFQLKVADLLVLRFDDHQKLASWQTVQPRLDGTVWWGNLGFAPRPWSGRPHCTETGCFYMLDSGETSLPYPTYSGVYAMFATAQSDSLAKRFAPAADQCAVFLYSKDLYWIIHPVEVWLDGQPAGWLLSHEHYFAWDLMPGKYDLFVRVTAGPSKDGRSAPRPALEARLGQIECVPGELYFFEPKLVPNNSFFLERTLTLKQRAAIVGQKAINKRRRVLSTYAGSRSARSYFVAPDVITDAVEIGTTARKGLSARLGQPDIETKNGQFLAYVKEGRSWFKLLNIDNGMPMFGQQYLYFIWFDSNGIASGHELRRVNTFLGSGSVYLTDGQPKNGDEYFRPNISCSTDGNCVAAGSLYARYATTEESSRARSASASKGRCLINIFSKDRNALWRVSLDGRFLAYVYDRLWPRGFLQLTLEPGQHLLTVEGVGRDAGLGLAATAMPHRSTATTEEFDCEAGRKLFVALRTQPDQPQLLWRADGMYEEDIRQRHLINNEP
jgi:hypothetical protein